MDVSNQIGYCILTYFRLGLALALAINLFVLPLTFFYFKQFPLMSLFYNFFFPFFVSISMFLLILGILFSLIYSPMGQIIHFINNYYTEWVLSLTFNLPSSVDIFIYSDFFSLEMTIIFVVMISWLGILLKSYFAKQKVEQDFAYL